MPEFLTILILTPTAIALLIGVLYAVGMIVMSVMAGVEAIVVTAEHRADPLGHAGQTGHPAHFGHA
jgi:hypothetical protein